MPIFRCCRLCDADFADPMEMPLGLRAITALSVAAL